MSELAVQMKKIRFLSRVSVDTSTFGFGQYLAEPEAENGPKPENFSRKLSVNLSGGHDFSQTRLLLLQKMLSWVPATSRHLNLGIRSIFGRFRGRKLPQTQVSLSKKA